MKKYLALFSILAFTLLVARELPAQVAIGQPAPHFKLQGSDAKTYSLKQFLGKYVVLEWTNHECPFVRKQYDSKAMQNLQKEVTAKGVVWLSIISSAPGKQGYVTAAQENDVISQQGAAPTAALLDPTGKVGHLYGAKTTPHMFVINPQGVLIYMGAIDDKPSTNVSDVPGKNYVSIALEEAMANKPVTMPVTTSYGCSVKY